MEPLPEHPSKLDTVLDEDPELGPGEPLPEGARRPTPAEVAAAAIQRGTARISSAPTGDLRRGARIVGGYELLEELGQGGCGTVYRAHDPKHDRLVALKLFLRRDLRSRERYRREVQAISRLRHPRIVPLFDSGEAEDHAYMVMEFVDGTDLARIAERRAIRTAEQRPSVRDVVTIIRDAAEALVYAHEEGILHRDIKPQNVLVGPRGEAYLADFGLAVLMEGDDERITQTGVALGTPAYMSPEQVHAKRDRIDARTDVYSLGAALFHALTGETPFEGMEAAELLFAVARQPARAPSSVDPEVPPDLDAIVLRCLEKEPDDRYPSARALVDDLNRFLAGESIDAPAEGAAGAAEVHPPAPRSGPSGLVLGLASLCVVELVAFLLLLAKHLALLDEVGR